MNSRSTCVVMAPDDDAARPEERLLGLTDEEWGGVIAGVVTATGTLWITADFSIYVQAGAVLIGMAVGITAGVSAIRSLIDRPRER